MQHLQISSQAPQNTAATMITLLYHIPPMCSLPHQWLRGACPGTSSCCVAHARSNRAHAVLAGPITLHSPPVPISHLVTNGRSIVRPIRTLVKCHEWRVLWDRELCFSSVAQGPSHPRVGGPGAVSLKMHVARSGNAGCRWLTHPNRGYSDNFRCLRLSGYWCN